MGRLTRKHDKNTYAVEMQECETEQQAKQMLMDNFGKCCKKLGKLEDLEEQIGMPLEVLLSLKTYDGIYAICNKYDCVFVEKGEHEIIQCRFIDTNFEDIALDYLGSCSVIIYPLNQFGISWFLTREEAEKKFSNDYAINEIVKKQEETKWD